MHHDIIVHLIISGFRLKKTERMRYLYFDLAYAIFTLYSDKHYYETLKLHTPVKERTVSVCEFLYMNSIAK